jgi:Bacterial protein of unknown function (DUF903)
MNRFALLFSIGLAALCGCAHTYVITLDNGRRITTASKPHRQNGRYVFKDAAGRTVFVSANQVREIAPASMVKEEKTMFNAQPGAK